jgi:hypothetical protein
MRDRSLLLVLGQAPSSVRAEPGLAAFSFPDPERRR